MPDNQLELIKKAKKGDKNAFGDIYRLFLTKIYRFVFYLVSDKDLAEDITQDTFVRAWKYLPNFSQERGTIQAYLFAIARNLVIDTKRKKKEFPLYDSYALKLEAKENSESKLITEDTKDVVQDALSKLEYDEKEVVILRYFEDLSYTEIAKVLKKEEGLLRVKVHRALKKLREHLKGYGI